MNQDSHIKYAWGKKGNHIHVEVVQDNPDRKTKQGQGQRVRYTAEYNEGGGKGVQQSNQIRKEVNSYRERHHEYRTPLRYITGRKHLETAATRQN